MKVIDSFTTSQSDTSNLIITRRQNVMTAVIKDETQQLDSHWKRIQANYANTALTEGTD